MWLFSSGPLGSPAVPDHDAVDVRDLVDSCAARDHRLFSGRLDKHTPGFAERAIVAAVHAPEGDYRDWDAIEAWAKDIAGQLSPPTSDSPAADIVLARYGASSNHTVRRPGWCS